MTETRKITLQFPSLRAFLAEYGERISSEGMLLRSEAPPAAGSAVEIEVVVAEGMRLLRARGETLWSGAGTGGGPQAAVRFAEMDDPSRTLIARIVDQRRREGAEPFTLDDVPGPREARLRELTVPAAGAADAPAGAASAGAGDGVGDGPAPAGAVFDLGEPVEQPALDLFGPAASAEPPPAESAPVASAEPPPAEPAPVASAEPPPDEPAPVASAEPPRAEPAPPRKPAPPVPLLADPEPAPFDLELQADGELAPFDLELPAEEEPAAAAGESEGGRQPELAASEPPAAGPEAEPPPQQPAASAGIDLSELFEGDEPAGTPAAGRTEAFPPSFVDEVEAELEAAGERESSYRELDTDELEIELSPPGAEPSLEPAAPAAAALDIESGSRPAPAEAEPEPTAAPVASSDSEPSDAAPAPEDPLREAPPRRTAQSELAAAAALIDETRTAAESAASNGPPPGEDPLSGSPADPPPPVAGPGAAPPRARGPETVEIPILRTAPSSDPPEEPASEASPPLEEPPGTAPPPVVTAPAGPSPTAPPPTLDDNLLALPELEPDGLAAPAVAPVEPPELPSSAESLRGAASRSRHLGTWFLIALFAAALAVAGYFIFGLLQGGGAPEPPRAVEQTPRKTIPPPPPRLPEETTPSGQPETPGEETPAGAPEASPGETAVGGGEDAAPSADEPEPRPEPEPAAPATGLERITWTESDRGTLLALVGNGPIARRRVDLVAIEGASPRLVIKIAGVERAFQPAVLEVGTSEVERVRTGLQANGELHVVVDLTAPGIAVRDLTATGPRLEVRIAQEPGG